MKIKLTDFSLRHFDNDFKGTKILDISPDIFQEHIDNLFFNMRDFSYVIGYDDCVVHDGYAPFCKLLAIKNFTDAKVGTLPITLENYIYLRTGYFARREGELPVFSRWFELPWFDIPKAEWLVLVIYNKEQIDKEGRINEGEYGDPNKKYAPLDADWGIVAILAQSQPNEEPMKPETMLRNALGIEEGGSGKKLDREEYMRSVEFWNKHATIK